MIDYLSTFSKKTMWLKPLFLFITVVATIVFGYVLFTGNGTGGNIYIIPSIVTVLWSLICWCMLSFFPNVPPKVGKQQKNRVRLKNSIVRGSYYVVSYCFIILNVLVLLLTLKLLSVWRVDFY